MRIDSATLMTWLLDGDELALLDPREEGVFYTGHLFHAACVPLSALELELERRVPRRSTRIVWCDAGDGDAAGLAQRAMERAAVLGWTNQCLLDGGLAAWSAAGGEIYEGVNVPSKAFGEFVEHTWDTPRIPPAELERLIDDGESLVVLDSRPMAEFTRMSIPTGVDCPGAELVHRIKEVTGDPETLVVVNCAGRTRSIIGAQSLINAGLENRVVALENGTMGWHLAGLTLDHGQTIHAPDPSPVAERWSTMAASQVGERFGVELVDHEQLSDWQNDANRTTYLLDVRTDAEFRAGHLVGCTHAPGGQLVQATDEYVATRNARLVLVDDNGVRATMTASWLRQLGWNDAVVLNSAFDGRVLEKGAVRPQLTVTANAVESIAPEALAARLNATEAGLGVLDLGTSLKYRQKGHIPGSWWGVRARLPEARETMGELTTIVLTSSEGLIAKLAVPEAQALWPNAAVLALEGGNKSWRHGGHPMTPGFERPTTAPTDVWYKPYDHEDHDGGPEALMRQYLTWEVALVEQLDRDPTVSFPRWD